jgi:hypothetical protein
VPARFVTTDSAAALSAGLDGLGIIVLAEFVASHYLASRALVRVLPGWQCPSLPLLLVTPTSRKRAARVQAFMDWAHHPSCREGAHVFSVELSKRRRVALPSMLSVEGLLLGVPGLNEQWQQS